AWYRPRRFVPAGVGLGDWPAIAPLFDQLESRLECLRGVAELEQWLVDWGELGAALDEGYSRRYIAMTRHTEDGAAKAAYLQFIEKVEPEIKPRQFKLSQLFIANPWREKLPRSRYEVFERDTRVQVELFRPENVPLETDEAKLGQQYQELAGSLT